MSASVAIANAAWLASNIPAWLRFRRALKNPEETQQRILRQLLSRNSRTAYGRAFNFESIRNYEDFKNRVPISDYEDLAPWIERIKRGEASLLTAEPVSHLIPTSGSTGGRKLIPFTAAFQSEINAAVAPWVIDLCRLYPSLTTGTSYWSISPARLGEVEDESVVPIGFEDDSGYLGGVRRRLVETTFAVPSILRLAPDLESFRYLTLLCLLRRPDLSLISVWHPSFLALLLDALPIWWKELLDDVRTGECPRASSLPLGLRKVMTVRPMPTRARQLSASDPRNPQQLWPRLKVVSCWSDAQASLARAALQRRLPQIAIQPKGLLATEALVSIPFQGLHPLAVTSHFFEFCDEDGGLHLAQELCEGRTYSIIVTTGGGLWRYKLGDKIEVDGFLDATPSLRFLGREGKVSDICGEKLAETFVTQSIEKACSSIGCSPNFAILAPEVDETSKWGYTLFFEGDLSVQAAQQLDRELCENPNYALCRRLGQLRPARCFRIDANGYAKFVSVNLEEGRRLGDIKPQALSRHTRWADIFKGDYCQ